MQHKNQSAVKYFFGSIRVLLHLKQHAVFARVLQPLSLYPIIKKRTRFLYLFSYVSRALSTKMKLSILTAHYRFLQRIFPFEHIRDLFGNGIECWRETVNGETISVRLVHSAYLEFEGSLSLLFYFNNCCVYTLSFTMLPSEYCALPGTEKVIFISLLQGKIRAMAGISRATKLLNDLIPSTILLAVVEGIALSMGIKKIVGVSAANQLSTEVVNNTHISNYNSYWLSQGAVLMNDGNYLFGCPLQHKPIESIKAKYRGRTIAKRAKRAQIAAHSRAVISDIIRKKFSAQMLKRASLSTVNMSGSGIPIL